MDFLLIIMIRSPQELRATDFSHRKLYIAGKRIGNRIKKSKSAKDTALDALRFLLILCAGITKKFWIKGLQNGD